MEQCIHGCCYGGGEKGCISIKRASEQYDVPRTTLRDRLVGRVQHGVKPGPKPYLNEVEEKDLAEFLEVTSSIGYDGTG